MTISLGEGIAFMGVVAAVIGLAIKAIASSTNERRKLYSRMDAEKLSADNLYVRKNLCDLQHANIKNTLEDIKVFMGEVRSYLMELKGKERR